MYINNRRIYIKDKIRFSIFLATVSLLIMIVFNFTFSHKVEGHGNSNLKVITVDHGDTLWDIVSQYTNDKYDLRKEIYHVKKINQLKTSYIYSGQELMIPIRE